MTSRCTWCGEPIPTWLSVSTGSRCEPCYRIWGAAFTARGGPVDQLTEQQLAEIRERRRLSGSGGLHEPLPKALD